jgi:glycosyltransferase involved in cell wall biosynthesis
LAEDESEALNAAARVVTPHRAIASHFGSKALLLDWKWPEARKPTTTGQARELFFPASPLGRKGIYELEEALQGIDAELLVLGRASEEDPSLLASVSHRPASVSDLAGCKAMVLPAWIEHQPRLALRALANGIPVVASAACGLPEHPLLHEIEEPDAEALREVLEKLLSGSEQGEPALVNAS